MKFQDDISMPHTYVLTYMRTTRNQYAAHFYKVWGIKTRVYRGMYYVSSVYSRSTHSNFKTAYIILHGQFNVIYSQAFPVLFIFNRSDLKAFRTKKCNVVIFFMLGIV